MNVQLYHIVIAVVLCSIAFEILWWYRFREIEKVHNNQRRFEKLIEQYLENVTERLLEKQKINRELEKAKLDHQREMASKKVGTDDLDEAERRAKVVMEWENENEPD